MEDKNCEQCGNLMRVVPAGISKKTGKSYSEFHTCNHCKPYGGKPPTSQPNASNEKIMEGLRAINENVKIVIGLLQKKEKLPTIDDDNR